MESRKPLGEVVRRAHSELLREHEKEQTKELHKTLVGLLSEVPDDELERSVTSVANAFGLDPQPILDGMRADSPMVSYRDNKPGFGLDTLDQCYHDACDAAGGEWHDDATIRGCKAPANATPGEAAAVFLAWEINSQECLWRTAGGFIGGLLKGLF
jgi:hypothetical protein